MEKSYSDYVPMSKLSRYAALIVLAITMIWPNTARSAVAEDNWYERLRIHKASPQLYYGRQPRTEDLAKLKQFGIRTVVNLRLNESKATQHAAEARQLGMNYVHLPVGFFIPPDKEIETFLQLVRSADKTPIYLHCQGAWHRAPLFVCAYRVRVQGWTYDRAYSELRAAGHFKPWFYQSLQRGLETVTGAGRPVASGHGVAL